MSPDARWALDDRLAEAADCIAEAQEHGSLSRYAGVIKQLPALLRQHGLGQTLAYCTMRGGGREASPYHLIYFQIARRLSQIWPLTDRDLLTHLTRTDSREYLQMAEEARLFTLALYDVVEDQEYAAYDEEER